MMRGVPRVSEAHLAARRQQILDAARVSFLRDGFHNTSMQDVIREAGLSVGAVYRYFPSKNDIIVALAEQVIGQVIAVIEELAEADPPPPLSTSMELAVDIVTTQTGPDGTLRLALQIWSEALRDPVLAAFVETVYRRIRVTLVRLAQAAQQHGDLPPDADPEAVGVVLFAMMPGYALQRILTGGPEPDLFKSGLRTLLAPAGP
jgi:AcrR family transcriptional regulator